MSGQKRSGFRQGSGSLCRAGGAGFDARENVLPSLHHAFAVFGRNLEYYTGFVFEVIAAQLGVASPIAGGGRYDELLARVGAPIGVPAIGSCIHSERLLAVNG